MSKRAPEPGKATRDEPLRHGDEQTSKSPKVMLAAMLVLTVLGLWIVWESLQLGLTSPFGVGRGLFPLISGVVLLSFGLIGTATEAWRLSRHASIPAPDSPADRVPGANAAGETGGGTAPQLADEEAEDVRWGRFWTAVGFIVGFVVALDYLGFVLTSGLLVFGLLTLVARRKVLLSAVLAVATAAFIGFGFGELLSVQLPSPSAPFLQWMPW